ncbi:FAD-dependent monooxygenase [Saccharopolyspora sp. NPDC050389]|uniref:FAD-dependent monooxygenase n=1 Tax=Saccharopolyspora sp. NPDC050389 TaxID=3155516 RepID=UPI0033EAEF05
MNILISGAGIAGPALAFWLRRYGFNPTVVERAPAIRHGGYAIDVRGAAVEVAERMGILSDLQEARTGNRGMTIVDSARRPLVEVRMDELMGAEGGDVELMRGTLSRILYERTDDTEYLLGDSITAIEQHTDAVRVTFEHHSPREFDLVVGADGMHSTVRQLAFGPETGFRRYLGYHISIFSVDNFLGLDRWTEVYNAPGRLAGLYRARTDTGAKAILGFKSPELRFDPRDPRTQIALLDKAFTDGWEVPRLLEEARRAPDFYFDSISQIHLDDWARGRVVLLGDAGYCPSPLSGQGSSLALVGAYVLAGELLAADGDHQTAFRRYEAEMRNFVTQNQGVATDGAKALIPKTATGLWLRNQMFRLMRHFPQLNGMSKGIQNAANAIDLRDYAPAA